MKILRKIKNKMWTYRASEDLIIMQSFDKLLTYQYKNGKFNRYDIIVRYLAIENYFGDNDYGFSLYNKMQSARGRRKKSEAGFKKLIDSVTKKGFDYYSLISVDKNQGLMDGSHRLALALYFNIELIPLRLNRFSYNICYGMEWFKSNGFTDNEMKLIEDARRRIFYDNGLYFQVLLWPPVEKHFEKIKEEFLKRYRILDSYVIDAEEGFAKFVSDIYASDDIDDWKINKKISEFEKYDKKVAVIEIEVFNPEFRKKKKNNHDLSKEVEAIKKEFRAKYMGEVTDYFHDIIMHIGDNYQHTREMAKVLKNKR